jgi:hypothetical protein
MKRAIGVPRVPDKSLKQLSGDPDDCTVEIRPGGVTRWKFRPGALVLESDLNRQGGLARTIIRMPGAEKDWILTPNAASGEAVMESRPLRFALRAVGRRHVSLTGTITSQPAPDGLRFTVVLPESGSLTVDQSGSAVFAAHGRAYLSLGPWTARDSDGRPLKMAWEADPTGGLTLRLAEPEAWTTANYPVEVS